VRSASWWTADTTPHLQIRCQQRSNRNKLSLPHPATALKQASMNPSMSNYATLMYVRDKTTTAAAATAGSSTTTAPETAAADVATSTKPRDSTGVKLSRKMKALFSSKTERQLDADEATARKSAFYRQFVEAGAFVNTGRR
jgi:hypothetical protein